MKEQHDDLLNQQLGNYKLVKLLGQGGFADVYLGEHIHLHTQAAIKVLRIRLTNENVDNFRKEAQTIAHLEHPHIVRILEYGIERDLPFLVMSYAPHGSLRGLHPRGERLPLSTITTYVRQAASALEYGHEQRIIHRDVKPENMLLSKNNEVLLSDFGIALIAQSSRHQSTPDVTGTAIYMAPEQTQGRVVPASDQYALAIVAYEWLTGEPPFKGSMAELIAQHLSAPVPPPQDKVPGIAPDIVGALYRALAKDPNQRFPSITSFANALASANEETHFSATPISLTPPPPPGVQTPIIPPPPPPSSLVPKDPYQGHPTPYAQPHMTPAQPMQGQPAPNYTPIQPTPLPSTPTGGNAATPQLAPVPPTQQAPVPSAYATVHQPQPEPPTQREAEPATIQQTQVTQNATQPTQKASPKAEATPTPPKAPKRKGKGKIWAVVISLLLLLAIVGGGAFYVNNVLLAKQSTATSTPTTVAQVTATPIPTQEQPSPTPTLTPSPTTIPETVLYQANWSTGADNWKTSGQWKWISNGSLGSDGTSQNGGYTIIAPYKPTSSDYAIEAVIQYNNGSYNTTFGLVARSTSGQDGYAGTVDAGSNDVYIAHMSEDSLSDSLSKQDYNVDSSQHTYRLEVKGNSITFFIDGQQISQVTDNRYTSAGQVGIRARNADLNVLSFKVVALQA